MLGIHDWKPVIAMLVFDLISAVTTTLIKKALQEGLDRLVLITLRQLVAIVFLALIAYFKERSTRPKLTLEILVYLFFSAAFGAALSIHLPLQTAVHECDIRYNFHQHGSCAHFPHCSLTKKFSSNFSLVKMTILVGRLSKKQKEIVIDCGFGSIVALNCSSIPNNLVIWLAKHYDSI